MRLFLVSIIIIINLNYSAQLYVDTDMGVLNGAIIKVQNNFLQTDANANLENAGDVVVDYDLINNGVLTGFSASTGVFTVGGNWVNNNIFNADNSIVHLYNADKLISGSSVTDFYTLKLTGGKKLMTIDASAIWLDLGTEHLLTGENIMLVNNPDPLSLIYSTGFVSSRGDGNLQRKTNTTNTYMFPLGSDLGDFRMRPIDFIPKDDNVNVFGARLANNKATENGYSLDDKSPLVGKLNPLYYHHLYHSEGNSLVDVRFYYDYIEDQVTETIGHWSNEWSILDNVLNEGASGSFSSLLLSNYNDFNERPFILGSENEFIYIPNTFTPNNDGDNDLFKISYNEEDLINFSFLIFDRWGNIVLEEHEPNFIWDGTYKGQKLVDGAYIWKMNYQLEGQNNLIDQLGHLFILK